MVNKSNWLVKQTVEEVASQACDFIVKAAQEAIQERGVFKIVLFGGRTPEHIHSLLVKEPCDWQNWHFYLGDERCLPVDDSERNSQMIQNTLLDKIDAPEGNIHFIPSELGAEEAAKAYDAIVKTAMPFDVVLLGMGEDGHTASLFPNHKHPLDERVHAIFESPKPPSDRVSLSVHTLSQNRTLLTIVTGQGKYNAVQQWRNGVSLPVSKITSLGKSFVILDNAAWSGEE